MVAVVYRWIASYIQSQDLDASGNWYFYMNLSIFSSESVGKWNVVNVVSQNIMSCGEDSINSQYWRNLRTKLFDPPGSILGPTMDPNDSYKEGNE